MHNQHFLKDFSIPCNYTSIPFSLTQPKHQEDLLSFFKVVMECYRKTNRSLEFLIDLFQLDIHPSESFEIQFSVILKKFITDHKLQKIIHNDIIIVIVSSMCRYEQFYVTFPQSMLSSNENSFVQIIVNTMIQVLLNIVL